MCRGLSNLWQEIPLASDTVSIQTRQFDLRVHTFKPVLDDSQCSGNITQCHGYHTENAFLPKDEMKCFISASMIICIASPK